MKFWDASSILPLCLREPRSPLVRRIVEEDGVIVAWWGTPVECFSTFARLRREKVLDPDSEDRARGFVTDLAAVWAEIQPGTMVREGAGRVLRRHPLRAADSLQLAAALVWAQGLAEMMDFVCLDHRLRDAARLEGFRILPELSPV
jgi:predicted nucleic acid-binding protein